MSFSSFFSKVQEAPWYKLFLDPVINEVRENSKLLDVGTGTGKMIKIIAQEKNALCIGIDTSFSMLEEAKRKLEYTNAELILVHSNEQFPFEPKSFDYVTICNVLFNLPDRAVDFIIDEALRTLKREGKIIVLTPTGKGDFLKLTKNFFSIENLSIYIWYYATKRRANNWNNQQYLHSYSAIRNLDYHQIITLHGFAQLEVLQ